MKTPVKKEFHHPLIIRLTHWVNAAALLIMITSGLRIYNAHPDYGFTIPSAITLGGWLGGARMWHFFAMWVFFVNGIIYVLYNISTKHGRHTTLFSRSDVPGVLPMIKYYLRIIKEHPPRKKYNALQKLAYTTTPLLGIASIVTGMSIYWPTQFSWLTRMLGGFELARGWHFLLTMSFVMFILGHLFMVAIAGWRNFLSIFTGWGESFEVHVPPPPPPQVEEKSAASAA